MLKLPTYLSACPHISHELRILFHLISYPKLYPGYPSSSNCNRTSSGQAIKLKSFLFNSLEQCFVLTMHKLPTYLSACPHLSHELRILLHLISYPKLYPGYPSSSNCNRTSSGQAIKLKSFLFNSLQQCFVLTMHKLPTYLSACPHLSHKLRILFHLISYPKLYPGYPSSSNCNRNSSGQAIKLKYFLFNSLEQCFVLTMLKLPTYLFACPHLSHELRILFHLISYPKLYPGYPSSSNCNRNSSGQAIKLKYFLFNSLEQCFVLTMLKLPTYLFACPHLSHELRILFHLISYPKLYPGYPSSSNCNRNSSGQAIKLKSFLFNSLEQCFVLTMHKLPTYLSACPHLSHELRILFHLISYPKLYPGYPKLFKL